MDRKRASRMSGVPQLTIPDIFIDDDEIEGHLESDGDGAGRASSPTRDHLRGGRT